MNNSLATSIQKGACDCVYRVCDCLRKFCVLGSHLNVFDVFVTMRTRLNIDLRHFVLFRTSVIIVVYFLLSNWTCFIWRRLFNVLLEISCTVLLSRQNKSNKVTCVVKHIVIARIRTAFPRKVTFKSKSLSQWFWLFILLFCHASVMMMTSEK